MPHKRLVVTCLAMAGAAQLVGCGLNLGPGLSLSGSAKMQALAERLARPPVYDWTAGLVSSPDIRAAKKQHRFADPTFRGLPGFNTGSLVSEPLALRGRTLMSPMSEVSRNKQTAAKIEGVPCFNYYTGAVYWLAEDGTMYCYTPSTNTWSSFTVPGIPTGDSFPHAYLTSSGSGGVLYFTSKLGNFFALDTSTGSLLSGCPYAMGGASSDVGYTCAPWPDSYVNGNSGAWDAYETEYAVNNTGLLHRFAIDLTSMTVTMAQNYQLPNTAPSGFQYLYKDPIIVLDGKGAATIWKHNSSDPSQDVGMAQTFDTGCSTYTTGTSGTLAMASSAATLGGVAHEFVTVDCDASLIPKWGFVPAGLGVTMIDFMNPSLYQNSQALVLNDNTVNSGSLNSVTVDVGANDDGITHTNCEVEIGDGNEIYTTNCNALWKLNYSSLTYDSAGHNPYDPAVTNWNQRKNNFASASRTRFALTSRGLNDGVIDPTTGAFLYNNTNIVNDGATAWLLDANGNPDTATGTSFNVFDISSSSPTVSPSRISADGFDVTSVATSADSAYAQVGGRWVAYNYYTNQFVFSTRDNGNTGSIMWMFQ